MGGEKSTTASPPTWGRGSPPRGRGKVKLAGFQVKSEGITPAWAGKSAVLKVKQEDPYLTLSGELLEGVALEDKAGAAAQ